MSRDERGATLIEILLSLAIVLVGLLALFRISALSAVGSAAASRINQAQARAQSIIEAIRLAPAPALQCLAGTTPSSWGNCETICLNQTSSVAVPQSCIFTMTSMAQVPGPDPVNGQLVDRSQQAYSLVYDPSNTTQSSWVQTGGATGRLYDVQVTIGWSNTGAALPADHRLTLHTGIFQ